MRNAIPLALALALATPSLAAADVSPNSNWSVTVNVWGGVSRYDVLGLKHGVDTLQPQDGRDLLEGSFNTWGGSAVLRLSWLDVGALYEGSFPSSRADTAIVAPLAGIAVNLTDLLRLDLLGEFGGHRISNIGASPSFDVSQVKSVTLPYLGVRPTLSMRVPAGWTRVVFSVTPFARWDLVQKTVTVDVTSGTTATQRTYDVGGSTYGVVGAIGLEI